MWPHRRQPTRLPRPWDSPGKNTGVGCHFLLQCMKVKSESEVAQSCPTLSDPHGLQPTRLLHPWDFPGKNTRVGCQCFLRVRQIYSRAKNAGIAVLSTPLIRKLPLSSQKIQLTDSTIHRWGKKCHLQPGLSHPLGGPAALTGATWKKFRCHFQYSSLFFFCFNFILFLNFT